MNFCEILFSKILRTSHGNLLCNIIGYGHIKRLFRLALASGSTVHVLLVGSPPSAKPMFLTSMMHHMKNSYFTDGANSSKAGMIDYLFEFGNFYIISRCQGLIYFETHSHSFTPCSNCSHHEFLGENNLTLRSTTPSIKGGLIIKK